MKIVYHISDNDGRASAAIIYREFGVMQMMTKNDFIGLAYTKPFDIPEINPDVPETWYFVDIALNMETFAFIKAVLDAGHKVIHIDHHRNHEFIENKLDDEQKKLFEHENLICMYDMRESATLHKSSFLTSKVLYAPFISSNEKICSCISGEIV